MTSEDLVSTWEELLSNELRLTRLAARIIKENLNKSPIEIGNLIVNALDSQGVVIKVERELPKLCNFAYRRLKEIANHSGNQKIRRYLQMKIAHTEEVQQNYAQGWLCSN